MNRFEKLYYKILDNKDWEMEDLDCLLNLARQEGVDSCKVAPVSVSDAMVRAVNIVVGILSEQ